MKLDQYINFKKKLFRSFTKPLLRDNYYKLDMLNLNNTKLTDGSKNPTIHLKLWNVLKNAIQFCSYFKNDIMSYSDFFFLYFLINKDKENRKNKSSSKMQDKWKGISFKNNMLWRCLSIWNKLKNKIYCE